MTIARTPDGKWVLYRVADGQRLERWSIDAHHLLATGEYTTDPKLGHHAPSVSVAPGSAMETPPMIPALPVEHSPGVPLVAVTEGIAAAPFASPMSAPPTRRSRK